MSTLIKTNINRSKTKKANAKKSNFLDSMIKLKLTGGPKDLSKNIDKYLYQR